MKSFINTDPILFVWVGVIEALVESFIKVYIIQLTKRQMIQITKPFVLFIHEIFHL